MHFCTQCQRSYSRQENLARHVRAAHTNEARHACKDCPKRFSRTDLLRKHEKTHAAHSLLEGSPHAQDVTAASVSPARILTPDTSQNDRPLVIAPYQASEMGDLSLDITSYDDSAIYESRDEYGQGLFDFDLAWTFDFLEKNDAFQTEFLEPCSDVATSALRTNDTDGCLSTNLNENATEPPSSNEPSQTSMLDDGEVKQILDSSQDALLKITVIDDDLRTLLLEIATSDRRDLPGPSSSSPQAFPENRSLQYFLVLYMKLVHPRFPTMHIPTFSTTQTHPVLLMSMMLAGSCHSVSNVSNGNRFCRDYLDRCRHWLTAARERNLQNLDDLDHMFALFLCTFTATWSGRQAPYCRAELDRGVLALACRNNHLLISRLTDPVVAVSTSGSSASHSSDLEHRWLRWIDSEKRKRLGVCIYLLDCQYSALLQRQPYISKAETTQLALPCETRYWSAPSARAWTMMLGPALTPPSAYHLPTLSSILLEREKIHGEMFFPPLDEFSRTLYAYVLHTHIYEWRQNVCMLNSNCLTGNIFSFVPKDIGVGLREHRKWLENALEVWLEQYGSNDSCDHVSGMHMQAGLLLHHLGDLALRISFFDLYMLARRSATSDDISAATESICNTLAMDRTCAILDRAFKMIAFALHLEATSQTTFCDFELAVSLFIGGLLLWTTHHLRSRSEVSTVMKWVEQHFGTSHAASPVAAGTGDTTILSKLQHVIEALKSIHSVGYANLLATVLAKLCEEGIASQV